MFDELGPYISVNTEVQTRLSSQKEPPSAMQRLHRHGIKNNKPMLQSIFLCCVTKSRYRHPDATIEKEPAMSDNRYYV